MSLAATYVQYCTKHLQLKTVHADFFFLNVMRKSECLNISQKEF